MTEGIEIKGIGDLIQKVKARYEEEEKKAREEEKKNTEDLKATAEQEVLIRTKLAKAKQTVEKMEREYLELEAKIETEKKGQIEKGTIKEADVKSGKVSLNEFIKEGKSDRQISEEVIKQTTEELEQALKAIRSKNLEILNLEKELCETQIKIRHLSTYPGRSLEKSLESLQDFLKRELGVISEDAYQVKWNLEQIRTRLLLTEGKSLSPGYRWEVMTVDQAKKIALDPIFPESFISKLYEELSKYGPDESVNVAYFLGKGDSPGRLDVSLVRPHFLRTKLEEGKR